MAAAIAVAAVACSDDGLPSDFPNLPGGNPLVPEVAMYPFPCDFYLEDDPATRTGRRLVIPQEALPAEVPASIFAEADGFSMAPVILAYLPGGIDLASLPDPLDPGATLEDGASVFVIRTDTWERVAVLAELDQMTENPQTQALIIRAHQKLEPDTGYVVIITDRVRDLTGQPHRANAAFRHLRDGTPTGDPSVEKQRASFELVNQAIEANGLEPAEVALAWSFHTRSEEQVVGPLVEMQRTAWEQAAGDYIITSDATDSDVENRVIDGTFEAPNFLNADGLVELDGDGRPVLQGRADTEFKLVIPLTVDETRPVILYGHGFLDTLEAAGRGAVNRLCRERMFSAVATNLGFNESDLPEQMTILGTRLEDIHWVVSLHWQKITNFTSLVKLTRDRLAAEITHDAGNGPFYPLDGNNIHYSGISNGGTFGFVIASTSPALNRAAMIVGGGGLVHFLQRAVNWWDFVWFFESIWPDPLDMNLAMSLLQMSIDPIDSINYVHRLTRNRFAGLQPMQAALHMAVNDSQVRNILTEWVSRTAGVPLITPSAKDIWGLSTIPAPPPDGAGGVDSALWVYDEHVEPSPITNVPPLEDNGTHGTATYLPVMQEHWYQFIESGRFVQVCDGACDPD